jgi:hypothetical protein
MITTGKNRIMIYGPSAKASSFGGVSRPRAFAVLRIHDELKLVWSLNWPIGPVH